MVKRRIAFITPTCNHCEDTIDAILLINSFLPFNEKIKIINVSEHKSINSTLSRVIEKAIGKTGKLGTPTILIDDIALIGSEHFDSDLGALESIFGITVPI